MGDSLISPKPLFLFGVIYGSFGAIHDDPQSTSDHLEPKSVVSEKIMTAYCNMSEAWTCTASDFT